MRRPTWPERILQALLTVAIVFILWDVVEASTARVCRDYADLDGGTCYPWGWEGPFAEFWQWRSRGNYLAAQLLHLLPLLLAFILPFIIARRWVAIVAMIIVSLGGSLALVWVPYLMGW